MTGTSTTATATARPWTDAARPVGERVELLPSAMTLAEKVAQLGSRWTRSSPPPSPDGAEEAQVAPVPDAFTARGLSPEESSRHGLGQLTLVFGSAPASVSEGAARVVELQRELVDGTRLGVPAIVHEECLTGFTTLGARGPHCFTGLDLRRIVEPGELELFVGPSEGELPLSAMVRLTGPLREVGPDRVLTTPADVAPLA